MSPCVYNKNSFIDARPLTNIVVLTREFSSSGPEIPVSIKHSQKHEMCRVFARLLKK